MRRIMANNWFCKGPKHFAEIASGIAADFLHVHPDASSWCLVLN